MMNLLRKLLRHPAPPPVATLEEIATALGGLDRERAQIDDALRTALDRRSAALLADDDTAADRLDREIDRLGREQERGEALERRLLGQAALIDGNPFTEKSQ